MKTILFGACGRHNFGDLLFPHILEKLLNLKDFVVSDLINSDMTPYGGHKVENILNHLDDPANLILIGGEVMGCSTTSACIMLQNNGHDFKEIQKRNISYPISKRHFSNPRAFIANSIGGRSLDENLYNYDYISTRNKIEGVKSSPDCANLTKYLFEDKIRDFPSEEIDYIKNSIGPYIAVQINKKELIYNSKYIIDLLKEVSEKEKLPIVLFCAGLAPGHDCINTYLSLFNIDPVLKNCHYSKITNIWEICKLISNAEILVSTSLHTQIISTLYKVKTINISNEPKVLDFNKEWADKENIVDIYLDSFNEWKEIL